VVRVAAKQEMERKKRPKSMQEEEKKKRRKKKAKRMVAFAKAAKAYSKRTLCNLMCLQTK